MGLEQVFFAVIFFLAGITPELTGFGVATVSMALLPFILPLPLAIPLVAIISATATGIIAIETKTRGLLKYLTPLLVGSFIGVSAGMVFLRFIDEELLRTTLSVFLVAYALYGFFFKGHFLPVEKATGMVVGLFAGFFGASFNVHGPLVGLYSSSNGDLSKKQTKDLIATYMFSTGLFTIAGHTLSGRVTGEVLLYALFALPFLFAGMVVGKRMFKKVSALWAKRAVYAFVLVAGIALFF